MKDNITHPATSRAGQYLAKLGTGTAPAAAASASLEPSSIYEQRKAAAGHAQTSATAMAGSVTQIDAAAIYERREREVQEQREEARR